MKKFTSLVLALMISASSFIGVKAGEINIQSGDFITNVDGTQTFTISINALSGQTFADQPTEVLEKLTNGGVKLKAVLVGIFLTQKSGNEKRASKKAARKFVEFEEKGEITIQAESTDSSASAELVVSLKEKALKALQKQLANGAEFISPVFIIKSGDKETKELLKNGSLVFVSQGKKNDQSSENFVSANLAADDFFGDEGGGGDV